MNNDYKTIDTIKKSTIIIVTDKRSNSFSEFEHDYKTIYYQDKINALSLGNYIDEVKPHVQKIRHKSRWFNAVSVIPFTFEPTSEAASFKK